MPSRDGSVKRPDKKMKGSAGVGKQTVKVSLPPKKASKRLKVVSANWEALREVGDTRDKLEGSLMAVPFDSPSYRKLKHNNPNFS